LSIPFIELPTGYPITFDIYQRLTCTLLAMPSSCPTTLKSIEQAGNVKKTWQFSSFYSEAQRFCLHLLEPRKQWIIKKTLRGSSPKTDISNNITLNWS
jgi:hypothetical protein